MEGRDLDVEEEENEDEGQTFDRFNLGAYT